VIVSHPHATPVASATAAALDRHGRLALYITGAAASPATARGRLLGLLAARRPVWRNRLVGGVDARRLRSLGAVELGARLAARAGRAAVGGRAPSAYDAIFVAHDRAAAVLPWPRAADAVYAYEDAALSTLRRAARRSMVAVLDVPAPYYRVLEDRWRAEWGRWPGAMDTPPPVEPAWKQRRKDAEIRLADVLSVASRHTRASLDAAGARGAVVVVPYGFPVDLFPAKAEAPAGPFTVLAVGAQTLRKGTHHLLAAWKKAALKDARLKLIGPLRLSAAFLREHGGLFQHLPHLPRAALGEEYRRSDLLAFPTLGDGFGLVMQEAMCSATPVVTTPSGGGPECITDGADGWIIPPADVDALVDTLRFCAANRDRTRAAGLAARARAERWTWREAGDALVAALDGAAAGEPDVGARLTGRAG
jgi:glycosyltransferase involved in cell wall biosynthesis